MAVALLVSIGGPSFNRQLPKQFLGRLPIALRLEGHETRRPIALDRDSPPTRCGSNSEVSPSARQVRSTLGSGHRQDARLGPVGAIDRDRGESCGSTPPTPPYVRVRIRRVWKLRSTASI